MNQITLRLTDLELKTLQEAIECFTDINNDTVTEDLFLSQDQESVTYTKQEFKELRELVEAKIDRMVASQSLYNKIMNC